MELKVTDVTAKYKSNPRNSLVDPTTRSVSNSLKGGWAKLDGKITSPGFSLQAALKGFTKNIGEFIQRREYQAFAHEVDGFLSAHLPPSSAAEHAAFRAIFLSQFDSAVPLPAAFADDRCANVAQDSRHLVFWTDRQVCLVSLFKQEVVFEIDQLEEVLAAYISPDSAILVVLQRTNYLVYSVQTGKLVFDYNKRKGETKNPFESDANHEGIDLNIGKVRCSIIRTHEKTHSRDPNETVSSDARRYQLIIGDREQIYLIDFKISEENPEFSVVSTVEIVKPPNYYKIETSEFIFVFLEGNEPFIVGVTESKGHTYLKRFKILLDQEALEVRSLNDLNASPSRLRILLDYEADLDGNITFAFSDCSPYRTGSCVVPAYDQMTEELYLCHLNSSAQFLQKEGKACLKTTGFSTDKHQFRQILASRDGKSLLFNYEDKQLHIWKQEGQQWIQNFIDKTMTEPYTFFLTPNEHFLVVRGPKLLKILPLGFDLKHSEQVCTAAEIVCTSATLRQIVSNNAGSWFLWNYYGAFEARLDGRSKLKKIFTLPPDMFDSDIQRVVPISGTADSWVLTADSGFQMRDFKLFWYRANSGTEARFYSELVLDPYVRDVEFSRCGKFLFITESDGETKLTVCIWSYVDKKVIREINQEAKCEVFENKLWVLQQNTISVFKLGEEKVPLSQIEVHGFKTTHQVRFKCFEAAKLLVISNEDTFAVIDSEKNLLVGCTTIEKALEQAPLSDQHISISQNGVFLVVADCYLYSASISIYRLKKYSLLDTFKVSHYSSCTFAADSSLIYIATDGGRELTIYSVEEKQIRASRHVHSDFLSDSANLLEIQNTEDPNYLDMLFIKQGTIIKVSLPTGNTVLLNLLFKLYPLVLKYFNTESHKSKVDICHHILQLLDHHGKYICQQKHLFVVLVYFMDQVGFFQQFIEKFVGFEELCRGHKIWNIIFHSLKVHSLKCFTDMFSRHIKSTRRYPYIDQAAVIDFLINKHELLSNSLFRYLLRILLFWRREEEFTGELKDPLGSVAYVLNTGHKDDAVKATTKRLLKDKPSNVKSLHTTETLVSLDFGNGSEFSAVFFDIISNLPEADIRDYYRHFVQFKWNKIYKFALVYSVIYWVMNLSAYVFYGFYFSSNWLGICLIVLNSLFLAFEVKCALAKLSRYLASPWNWIDMVVHSASIVSVIIILNSKKAVYSGEEFSWLRSILLSFLSLRGITMLRVFSQTRYLITMLFQVFVDVIPFFTVLCFGLMLFIYLWRILLIQDTGDLEGSNGFYPSLKFVLDLFFGQFVSEGLSPLQYALMTLGNIVLALVMANFLIALIGGTFERIAADKELYDVKDVISMINDFDAFLKGLIQRDKDLWKYYITVFESQEKSGDARKIMKALAELKASVEAQQNPFASGVSGLDVDALIARIDNRFEERLQAVEQRMNARLDQLFRRADEPSVAERKLEQSWQMAGFYQSHKPSPPDDVLSLD